MHSRGQLSAFLWPDSEPPIARKALRNALALLRRLLADPDSSPAQHVHLLSEGELLGLDPQAPLERDLDVVHCAWNEVQRLTTPSTQQQRAALITRVQHALTRWLTHDPRAEEAYRRLMRVHITMGNPAAALRIYAICRARLAEELGVKPSADAIALAQHWHECAVSLKESRPTRFSPAMAEKATQAGLVTPLVGRQTSFSQIVRSFQQTREDRPQAVFLMGEAAIDKTRLAQDWSAWAAAHGALALTGQAFEMGGRLPYQPLVEDLWLVPRVDRDGAFQLELGVELSTIIGQEQPGGPLLPHSVRALILARLTQLSTTARHLVQASAVLGAAANAQLLWQLAEVGVLVGVEALEEATRSGILREEETEGGRQDSYRFSHDLMRDVVYTELGTAGRQILHQRALARLEGEEARASEWRTTRELRDR